MPLEEQSQVTCRGPRGDGKWEAAKCIHMVLRHTLMTWGFDDIITFKNNHLFIVCHEGHLYRSPLNEWQYRRNAVNLFSITAKLCANREVYDLSQTVRAYTIWWMQKHHYQLFTSLNNYPTRDTKQGTTQSETGPMYPWRQHIHPFSLTYGRTLMWVNLWSNKQLGCIMSLAAVC